VYSFIAKLLSAKMRLSLKQEALQKEIESLSNNPLYKTAAHAAVH
jgi:hypothetical protein